MPVQLRRERLRGQMIEEIIAAARLLLEKDGHGAITVRAIARQVGVSAPAIYRYFASLDALLCALAESVISELCGVVDSARDEPGEMALAFRGWALEHPASFKFILGLSTCAPSTLAPSASAPSGSGPGGSRPGSRAPSGGRPGGSGPGGGASLTARLARHSDAPSPTPSSAPSADPSAARSADPSSAPSADPSAAAFASSASSAPAAAPAAMLTWATLCGLALLELACDPADLPEDIGWLYQTAASHLPR